MLFILLVWWYFHTQHFYLGKTTVLYSVKSDKSIPITPIGTILEKIVINNTSIAVIEEGGCSL
jgi:hypothetical protein